MPDKYLNTKDLCDRFRCSSRTIFRKMQKDANPMPQPLIKNAGASNLWCAKAIEEWEAREIKRTSVDRFLNEQEEISKRRENSDDRVH